MNMNDIRIIAEKVRKSCERFAKSNASKDYDFHNSDCLGCMCAVASFTLAHALKRNGIHCDVVHGCFYNDDGRFNGEHCWVEIGPEIVDITATQFYPNWQKVHIVEKGSPNYRFGKVKNDHRLFKNWLCQRPSPTVAKKILQYA